MDSTHAESARPPGQAGGDERWLRPGSIVIGYFVVASAWILLSGKAVDLAVGDDHTLFAFFEVAKGLAFVAVTSLVLLVLLNRYTERLNRAHEEARRMARFAELSPNPLIEFGPDGTIHSANAAANATAEALGLTIDDLLPPDTQDLVRQCVETGEHLSSVLHAVAGQSWRWAFFPTEVPISAYGYGYDRTQEARLELQVEHAARMESVGRLASGVAHDLNNILMAIGGYRTLVAMKLSAGDPSQEDLSGIQEQLDHAQELVKKLLLVARMRAMAENVSRVDLSEHVASIAATIRHVLPYSVQLEVDVAPGSLAVEVDIRDLEQAMLNLASNAADAITGQGVLRLAVHPARDGRVDIKVSDTGDGIPPEILPNIFDPFFTTKEEGKGTGLGLASVYAFAVRSGGTVEVESRLGAGSSFTIRLPAA